MTGATELPSPTGAVPNGGGFKGQVPSASTVNSQRIASIAGHLILVLDSTADTMTIFNLILELSRCIDYAVANTDVPARAQALPVLLKKICNRRKDRVLQVAVMVLMISVKIACKFEWFTRKDTEELLILANEIGSVFSSQGNIYSEQSLSLCTVVNVMSRFCPQVKTGRILASLEVNLGYGAHLVDFNIPKSQSKVPNEKIRLFVAQTDSIETSSCLISPPQANFLLNGKSVDNRTNVLMETRPQFPTDVTSLLKYGTNLLQAVGQFNGKYLIVIAYMSITSIPETLIPPDYVQPTVVAQDEDAEVIEGRSRISLNCPLSCKRIKTPAKGQSCKHLKSFDLDTFLELNMRTLSWRCPHCWQSTCYEDIRIDQYLAKVLKEVSKNVTDIIIFEDGSWKPGSETHDHIDNLQSHQNGSDPQENTDFTDTNVEILDLTEEHNETDLMDIPEISDIKPFQTNNNSQINSIDSTLPLQGQSQTQPLVDQAMASHIDTDFWSDIYLSTYGSEATSNSMLDPQIPPVLSDVVSPIPNRELKEPRGITTTPFTQNQFSMPNNTLQSQMVRSRLSSFASPNPNVTSTVSSSNGFNNTINNGGSDKQQQQQQQFSRSHMSPVQVPEMASSSFPHRTVQGYRGNFPIPNRSNQQVTNQPSSPLGHQNTQQQGMNQNQRIPHIIQPPNSMNRRPPHMARQHTPVQMQPARTGYTPVQPLTTPDGSLDAPSEQNWQPTGRMRGSLSGSAYSAALEQFMTQPSQPTPQATNR